MRAEGRLERTRAEGALMLHGGFSGMFIELLKLCLRDGRSFRVRETSLSLTFSLESLSPVETTVRLCSIQLEYTERTCRPHAQYTHIYCTT